MNDDEIYQKLKSGEAARYIKGIEGFDDSELVQWMASYHEEVKAELLEAILDLKFKLYGSGNASPKIEQVIKKALGQQPLQEREDAY